MTTRPETNGERTVTVEEMSRSLEAILKEAASGVTIHIERDGVELCVVSPSSRKRRMASEIREKLRRNPVPYPDEDFARDVLDGIRAHETPEERPSWD